MAFLPFIFRAALAAIVTMVTSQAVVAAPGGMRYEGVNISGAEWAVQLASQELGAQAEKDDRVAVIYNNLGNCLRNQGKLPDAEAAYKKALEIRQAALGPLHASEVVILENYAKLLKVCGRTKEAEKLEQRALGIMRR